MAHGRPSTAPACVLPPSIRVTFSELMCVHHSTPIYGVAVVFTYLGLTRRRTRGHVISPTSEAEPERLGYAVSHAICRAPWHLACLE